MSQPSVIVFSSTDVDKVPMLPDNQTFTGTNTFAEPIVITKAIGTAPLTITSTTVVTNLNTDMVDGKHTGTSGNTLPLLDGSNTHSGTNKFGSTSNYIQIDGSGELTMNGDATVWDDLMVSALATKLGGSKDPGFALFKDNGSGSQGVFTYWFDDSTEEEIYFSVQMPHSWKGTDIYPHVHWTPETTADGAPASQTVEWGLEYTWIDIGGDFANTSFIYGKAHTPADADVVAGRHYLTPLTTITPSATQDGISSMIVCRLFRNATDATDDTYEADAGLLQFDIHYEMDTIGSKTETAK